MDPNRPGIIVSSSPVFGILGTRLQALVEGGITLFTKPGKESRRLLVGENSKN